MHIIIDSGQLGLSLFLRSFPPSIRTQTHFKVIYIFVPILTVLGKKKKTKLRQQEYFEHSL